MIIDWSEWIGKSVFIKLEDGQVFSSSKILAYEEPFLSLTDKFGLLAVVNVKHIIKIREENDARMGL